MRYRFITIACIYASIACQTEGDPPKKKRDLADVAQNAADEKHDAASVAGPRPDEREKVPAKKVEESCDTDGDDEPVREPEDEEAKPPSPKPPSPTPPTVDAARVLVLTGRRLDDPATITVTSTADPTKSVTAQWPAPGAQALFPGVCAAQVCAVRVTVTSKGKPTSAAHMTSYRHGATLLLGHENSPIVPVLQNADDRIGVFTGASGLTIEGVAANALPADPEFLEEWMD